MSKNRYVDTRFWLDTYILDLDPSEKLLFIYFLTNSETNIAGIYEVSLRKVAMETGFDKETIERILNRFGENRKMFYQHNHIIIANFIRYQQLNPKVELGIANVLKSLPQRVKEYIKIDRTGLWYEDKKGTEMTALLSAKVNTAWMQELDNQKKSLRNNRTYPQAQKGR